MAKIVRTSTGNNSLILIKILDDKAVAYAYQLGINNGYSFSGTGKKMGMVMDHVKFNLLLSQLVPELDGKGRQDDYRKIFTLEEVADLKDKPSLGGQEQITF